ncbi:hypothetical protein HN011_006130 [Eciton burchellii]|jgi:hypothetical protein|nr:hypothetical protein HN011_006130 [Eciton burchellii]
MAVTRTTSTFRMDGGSGDDVRGSRRCNPRAGVRSADHRAAGRSSAIEDGSVTVSRGASGKFLLVGAVLAIQFVGAAAVSGKGECFDKCDSRILVNPSNRRAR